MKLKHNLLLSALALCGTMQAQDIYKAETLSGSDLTGTARFVGMGGAMSALGADMSTMSNNPAAIGLYRRSDVAMTASVLGQSEAYKLADVNKARASFDQAGFVYAAKLNGSAVKFVNLGFNYQKRRNLKEVIGLGPTRLNEGMSQSWQMLDLSYYYDGWLDLSNKNDREYTTLLTGVGYDTQMLAPIYDDQGKLTGYEPSYADSYKYRRARWGGIQQYDFNLSLNINDRVYGGITVGVYNVDIHSLTGYQETLRLGDEVSAMPYQMYNEEAITGAGVDVKFGIIFRPIEDSPFRIGFSFSTPTFYDLTQSSYLQMWSPYAFTDNMNQTYDATYAEARASDFDYRIYTPWKLNISAATTVGNWLAVDAEYEVSRYSGAQVRYPYNDMGRYPNNYDWDYDWGDYNVSSHKDRALCKEIDRYMKPVSTFRIGAEARLAKGVYARAGYNFVSAPFEKDAYLNLFTNTPSYYSPSYYYSTNTDYVNLGNTHRATLGLGYKGKHFYADVAYQIQTQEADVYAFHIPEQFSDRNRLPGQRIDLKRHHAMLTVGYKF